MTEHPLASVVEAVLLAAGRPVSVEQLLELFDEPQRPPAEEVTGALQALQRSYEGRGVEVREVASGWRVQVRPQHADVVSRLWQERPSRYSRALLETLALIAYRQPITRGEIEDIRGVTVSTTIMRTLPVVCLMLGYPLAYAIAFKSGRFKALMLVLVIAPFLSSFLLRTLAWRTILADQGPVTSFLKTIAVLPDDGRLLATPVAVIAGLIYNFLPFMTLPLYASLEKVDPRLIEAAGDLYSTPFTGFRKVTLPLSMPGVVSGTLLTFIPACGDYINAELLGTPKQYMVGNRIQSAFLTEHNYPLAASLSIILMLVVVAMVVVYVRRAGTEELI